MTLMGRIKGQGFTLPNLLVGADKADTHFAALTGSPECAVAVCRLAPQDYHRFHAPFDAEVVYRKDIKGELYSQCDTIRLNELTKLAVNPQAVNESAFAFIPQVPCCN